MRSVLTQDWTARTRAEQAAYWDSVHADWSDPGSATLWRQHSDRINGTLLCRWLPDTPIERALKTDLFDEAVGEGLLGPLQRARTIIGIDLSNGAVSRATVDRPQLQGLVSDVRRLPFASASFDVVISTSTLDHFGRASDIGEALCELNRVLRSGGVLVITMDNTRNPVVAIRGMMQGPLLRVGVVPYITGVSCDAAGLRNLLVGAGFEVSDETTVLHAPRVAAIPIAHLLDALGVKSLSRRYLQLLARFERLAGSRLEAITGYFVAARAVKH